MTYDQAVYLIRPIYAVLAGMVSVAIIGTAFFIVFWFFFRR